MPIEVLGADVGGGNVTAITDVVWPPTFNRAFALLRWVYISGRTTTAPTGFTHYHTITGGGSQERRLYYRICDGSESGAVAGWLISGAANRQSATLVVRIGVDPNNPIDGISVDTTHAAGTTHDCPAYTPTVGGCAIVKGISERASPTVNDTAWSTTWTERADSLAAATGTGGTIIAEADDGLAVYNPAGSPVTPPDWTGDNATGTANIVTDTLALRPISRPPWRRRVSGLVIR